MCGQEIWDWTKANSEAIKIVFTLIAAAFVVWQYFETKNQERIKQTMTFQERFGTGTIQQAYRDLSVLLLDNKQKLNAAGANANKEITALIEQNKYENKIVLLANFYSQVTTCVENNVCNRRVACSIFKAPITELRNNFYDLFSAWEKQWGQNFIAGPYEYFKDHCPK